MKTKHFKRNLNTFALCIFTLQMKYFFANDLFYIHVKHTENQLKKPVCHALSSHSNG